VELRVHLFLKQKLRTREVLPVTSTCIHEVLYIFIGSVSDRPALSVRRCVSRIMLKVCKGFDIGGCEGLSLQGHNVLFYPLKLTICLTIVSCLVYYLTLKMETTCSFETLFDFEQTL
jgi:hypothetical protein